jgi:hypothetical protein
MILVISSPSNSTMGFLTWIFLIPVDDAILCCPIWVKLGVFAVRLFAVVRRKLESWAGFVVWEARHRVAKLHVCRRGSRAIDVAARNAPGLETAGLIAAFVWLVWYNLGR